MLSKVSRSRSYNPNRRIDIGIIFFACNGTSTSDVLVCTSTVLHTHCHINAVDHSRTSHREKNLGSSSIGDKIRP